MIFKTLTTCLVIATITLSSAVSLHKGGVRGGRTRDDNTLDATKLFNILTSNNDIMVGDLRESMPYQMPKNLEVCKDSFSAEERSAEYLTNPPPSLPEISATGGVGGNYTTRYAQYKEDSIYNTEMVKTVARVDELFTQLYETGFIDMVENPSIMWDIDNTMAYTAFNDTDTVGDAPPIQPTVDLVQKWCKGWGSGPNAVMNCVFITARYCTEMNVKATQTWLKKTYTGATDELIETNVQFMGSIRCSCCEQGNIAGKDILRKDWMDGDFRLNWVASVGDQYTDSVGLYSGIKVKLPNVWFDASVVPNPWSMGTTPNLVNGSIREQDWSTSCSSQASTPLIPSPQSCVNPSSMQIARQYSSTQYCIAQTPDVAPDQAFGCTIDISTGQQTCPPQ